MSRILVEAELNGKKFNAILDTGSRRSYIKKELVKDFPIAYIDSFKVGLGGKSFTINESRFISGIIKDTQGNSYKFVGIFFPVDDLGEENGKGIDLLIGATILEDWGTVIDESVSPPKVDYTILRKGELIELIEVRI